METTTRELSAYNRDLLYVASAGHYQARDGECAGMTRYNFYRRHGHGVLDSFTYALAWLRNAAEQYDRRLGHDTGAEGWRPIT